MSLQVNQEKANNPLGVFDSGVGGLSVVKELRKILPNEDILYFADSGNIPYGVKSPDDIYALTESATEFLLAQGAKALVIACNTASTNSVARLRQKWPELPIVGMVPAVKPAASMTRSGVIGVLATEATGKAPALLDVIDRFASDVEVLVSTPPGLVEAVESGRANSPEIVAYLQKTVTPLLERGADALVLGCTHFPFLRPALETVLHGRMRLIDSGEAVARQTERVLTSNNLLNQQTIPGKLVCFSTGDLAQVRPVLAQLLNLSNPAELDLRPAPLKRLSTSVK
ncbi:MAG TPA: glutamate racemase [Chloroflexia bacterium]|nr:glutamate racemase [Chloroflexia bacterium]